MKKRYVVAFSGGVDSTAAILMLLDKGFDVEAVIMDWIPSTYPAWTRSKKAIEDACRIAKQLQIKCRMIDLKEEFEKKVIRYFIETYISGRTPNPCVLCNRHIKFGLLLQYGKEGDKIFATGHYAGIEEYKGKKVLVKGKEKKIEQSYFLTLIKPEVLDWIEFPLYKFTRKEVEDYIRKKGFPVKEKSQEICFVDGEFWELIEKRFGGKEGWIIGPEGEKLRKINDFYRYTVGQRKGLRVAYGKPLYVKSIDPARGNVFVATKEQLGWKRFTIKECNWFVEPEEKQSYLIKVRYRTPPSPGKVILSSDGCTIELEKPQVIVPGQVAAVYDGEFLLGGGIIEERWEEK